MVFESTHQSESVKSSVTVEGFNAASDCKKTHSLEELK